MGNTKARRVFTKEAGAVSEARAEDAAKPDVASIMSSIRRRVKENAAGAGDLRPAFKTRSVEGAAGERKAGEMVNSEDLLYLNRNYSYPLKTVSPDSVTSHRKILGWFIVKIKRKILSFLWDHILKGYFEAEMEFNSSLVRFLNESSKYTDDRDAAIFWELIRKIDYDVNKAVERIERISDEQTGSLRSAEKHIFETMHGIEKELNGYITKLQASSASREARIETLESVSAGLEQIVSRIGRSKDNSSLLNEVEQHSSYLATGGSASETPTDPSYLLFENRFRGSEERIKERLTVYPGYFEGVSKPVVEIGCGRGELQELFKEHGIPSYGIELDRAMSEHARSKGLDVRNEEGIAHLKALPEKSLGGLVAVQVIEHMTQRQLRELVALCRQKVVVGGRVVFETINSGSIVALTRHYFRDPTHVFPLHPETMRYLLELLGLKVLEIKKLSPFDPESEFKEIGVDDFMPPRWAFAVQSLNLNFRKLNDLLYGHQDYCIAAEVV